jgi:tRNA U34 5-methylaminomethyl-2-thiouridine-forming methyltransferase MnmC
VGRLAQRLGSEAEYKKLLRKRRKRDSLKEFHATVPQIAEWLEQIVRRAEDETFCNNICKSMYFCYRKKGHKGLHREGALSWN